MILVPLESAYVTSYWSLIVTLVLPCTVFEIRRLMCWKLRIFLPLSYSAPPLPMYPLEFRGEVKRQEARVMGLLVMKIAWSYLQPSLTDPPVCQTDGRTGGRAMAYSALFIARYMPSPVRLPYMLSRAKNHRVIVIVLLMRSSGRLWWLKTETLGIKTKNKTDNW